jgi:hypothetical protein
MSIDTALWAWPQFTVLIILFLSLIINAQKHGKLNVDKEGNPDKVNFFTSITKVIFWLFVLIAGGFFK